MSPYEVVRMWLKKKEQSESMIEKQSEGCFSGAERSRKLPKSLCDFKNESCKKNNGGNGRKREKSLFRVFLWAILVMMVVSLNSTPGMKQEF